MKTCRVLLVCLTLVGSASSVLGELPPPLTESSEQQSIGIVTLPSKTGLPAAAARLAATSELSTPRSTEERKLNYGKLERKLATLFPNSKVYLIPMAHKVLVRGQCPNEDEAASVINIVRAEVVELEPISWETPFFLDGSEPAVLTLNDLVRLKRNDLAAQRILNELRVGVMESDAQEVPPVPGFEVTPVASTPFLKRSLPAQWQHLLTADSHCLPTAACPTDLPRCLTGPPSIVPAPPTLNAVPMIESVPPPPSHVEQFQFHLARAEDQLRASGLTDEANQLQAMHRMFSAQHQGTLHIARKEAQLKALQNEIALLKRTTVSNATQVSLRVRLVELVKGDESWKAIGPLLDGAHPGHPSAWRTSAVLCGVMDSAGIHQLLEHLCRSGAVKIVAEPQMVVMNGSLCRFESGGEAPAPSVVGVGGAQWGASRSFGISIDACPVVVGDRIRLHIETEFTRLEDAVNQAGPHPVSSRRSATSVELRVGQTLVMTGLKGQRRRAVAATQTPGDVTQVGQLIDEQTRSDRDDVELLVVITPEIVRPMGPFELPPWPSGAVPNVEATRPFRLPPAPLPANDWAPKSDAEPQPR